ncbi:Bifunctional hemolysin/adenylate cyclase [Rhizobiaceae bacterium]|nr:Bifunctional hemolysin/adenylate cyclase [Rhizobiaceae bacterium]
MALQIIGSNSIGPGIRVSLNDTDSVFVTSGVTVGSTDNWGIYGYGSNHVVNIQGTVSATTAVYLGNDSVNDQLNSIEIGSSGYVAGMGVYAIVMEGSGNSLVNRGTIWSPNYAVSISAGGLGVSTVANHGLIAGAIGIWLGDVAQADSLRVVNTGTIDCTQYAFGHTGTGSTNFVNSGAIVGIVQFGTNDDVYDGRSGRIEGAVRGGGGNDTLQGGDGEEEFSGGTGRDSLSGGGGNDLLIVGQGDDAIGETYDGGTGEDTLQFGTPGASNTFDFRDDVLRSLEHLAFFDTDFSGTHTARLNAAQFGEGVSLSARVTGTGFFADILEVTMGSVTTLNLSGLTFEAFGNTGDVVRIVGDDSAETIVGTAVSDSIEGGGGTDTILGRNGADILDGGDGTDHLYGGLGADQHIGGAGIDFARYDDANYGSLTIRLDNAALNVGAAAVGDTYVGIECLVGGLGNDTVVGDNFDNRLYGQGGTDTIYGQAGNDILDGGAGNDFLAGGLGNDTLTGGANNDTFFFNTTLNAATNVDTITDFSVPNDTIRLEDAIFTAIGPVGTLAAAAFTIGAAATTAAHRIVYNSATGALIYDSNGSAAGGATQFAILGTGLALTNADFLIT